MNISFFSLIQARQRLFLVFSFDICAGKLGCRLPELILSRTTDVSPLCYFKAQPRYHAGLYRSGYRFKLQSLVNITRYVVSVFGKIFLWFLTYAPRLYREGRTIFVPDQLLTEVNRAVNLWAYCQNINELAKIMDFSFYFRYPQKKAIRPFREVPLLFLNYLQWLLLKKSLFTGEIPYIFPIFNCLD